MQQLAIKRSEIAPNFLIRIICYHVRKFANAFANNKG